MKYPELVTKLTTVCSGWIVGSAADPTKNTTRDYDIYVPMKYWREACNLIPKDAKVNRLGGFKCKSEGFEVDVWTGDLNDFVAHSKFTFAFHPISNTRIFRTKR